MDLPFLTFLEDLQTGNILLPSQWTPLAPTESPAAQRYLASLYQHETLEYPHHAPPFDAEAALWAARLAYYSAQLIVHRQQVVSELDPFFPVFSLPYNASAFLSADLSLRFMPFFLNRLRDLDEDDALLDLVLERLAPFSYSLLGSTWCPAPTPPVLEARLNPCFIRQFADRIIAYKDLQWAAIPPFHRVIKASLGAYAASAWPAFLVLKAPTAS